MRAPARALRYRNWRGRADNGKKTTRLRNHHLETLHEGPNFSRLSVDGRASRLSSMGGKPMARARNAILIAVCFVSNSGLAGEKQLCQLVPADLRGWHYRTKVPPLMDQQCWYEGEPMKPRRELYWAEAPAIP